MPSITVNFTPDSLQRIKAAYADDPLMSETTTAQEIMQYLKDRWIDELKRAVGEYEYHKDRIEVVLS